MPTLPPTPRCQRILERAEDLSRAQGSSVLKVEDLMLAILEDPHAVPTQVLAQFVRPAVVRGALTVLMESPEYNEGSTRIYRPPEPN
jgi:hypothetical protein